MKTINNALNWGEAELRSVNIATFKLDASILLSKACQVSNVWLIAHGEDLINKSQLELYKKFIQRHVLGEPIAYITSIKEFFGLNFNVNPEVLIPRVETEAMVEQIVKLDKKGLKFLDLGTGSGAVAVAIAKNTKFLEINAADISEEAINIAKHNAKKLTPNKSIKFIRSNLFSNLDAKFDIIAANLPYVIPSLSNKKNLSYEPAIALYGGCDGLDIYRDFFKDVNNYLNNNGIIFCEADPAQYNKLEKLAKAEDLKLSKITEYISAFIKD